MNMNLKDPQVHAMARELAEHRGTSVTDAVRQGLRAELDRLLAPADITTVPLGETHLPWALVD